MRVSATSSALDIVFIGLAMTSSWGNGHATTYRSLLKGLARRGHRVTFLERDQPWYAAHRDCRRVAYCDIELYRDTEDLRGRFGDRIRAADAVIVGSYVDDGRAVCEWVLEHARGVRAFYDIDTPVTLRGIRDDSCRYLGAAQLGDFDLVLSFAGGPTLELLRNVFGAPCAAALYCSVDLEDYSPQLVARTLALAYMGTYSADRQASIERFLVAPARSLPNEQYMVVGAQYPKGMQWPANVRYVDHIPPHEHARFYSSQRFTLNVTRADMRAAGYSPSVRLFEAAACEVPIISDDWPGLEEIFEPDEEILVAHTSDDVTGWLTEMPEAERTRLARLARERTLEEHSSDRRAQELERYLETALARTEQHRSRLTRAARAVG